MKSDSVSGRDYADRDFSGLEYAFSRPLSIDGVRIATFSDAVALIRAREAARPSLDGQLLLDRLMGADSYIEQIRAADAFQNWAADEMAA